jgi:hypothetical protein
MAEASAAGRGKNSLQAFAPVPTPMTKPLEVNSSYFIKLTGGQAEDQLKIFNEQGEECKPGEVGEIFFRSAGGQGSAE